ncbi:MAG: hypothetical protein U9R52_00895 [Candidatus Omnitrophota bacterium]|nr:hypothetical protein [Candidatus Omnitrophota bacterium]
MWFGKKKVKAKKTASKKRPKTKVKKTTAKRKAKIAKRAQKVTKKAPKALAAKETLMGKVTHYFPRVKAGAIMLKSGTLILGDTIHIKGRTTNFKQKIKSMEIDRNPINKASKGREIGILLKSRVRINDSVYKKTS